MRRRSAAEPELSGEAVSRSSPEPGPRLERRRRRRRSRPGALPALLALLLGASILWLAVPRVPASLWLAARDPVLERIAAGEPVSEAELLGLIASRELALGWVADRETHDERATALAELAFRAASLGDAERAMLERAIAATRAGLALAPADPRDWMQLGYLLVLRDGDPSREAAAALLLSMRVGPFQAPDLLRRRLFWALAHWAFYDEQERRLIDEQIRLAWRAAPDALAELALDAPEFLELIASALEEVPEAQGRFVGALADATPPRQPLR